MEKAGVPGFCSRGLVNGGSSKGGEEEGHVTCHLRTREKWKNWIRNNERGQHRPEYLPPVKDFMDIMEGISRAGLQPTWHKKHIDDIVFPEQRFE